MPAYARVIAFGLCSVCCVLFLGTTPASAYLASGTLAVGLNQSVRTYAVTSSSRLSSVGWYIESQRDGRRILVPRIWGRMYRGEDYYRRGRIRGYRARRTRVYGWRRYSDRPTIRRSRVYGWRRYGYRPPYRVRRARVYGWRRQGYRPARVYGWRSSRRHGHWYRRHRW